MVGMHTQCDTRWREMSAPASSRSQRGRITVVLPTTAGASTL